MPIRIKDIGSLAKKFVQRAQQAQGEYSDGVKVAGADWEANTKAAEENYKAAVVIASNEGRFGKGVAKAGAAKYTLRASTLGPQRYGQGVAVAEGEWSKGVQPHLQMMAGLTLPPRRPKGDPANQLRAQTVAQKNHELRIGK